MTPLVAVIIAVVGFGISTAATLCAVALIIRVLNAIEILVKGLAMTSQGVTELLHAIGELEDSLKVPETRNYIVIDGSRKAVLGTFAGHVDSDGIPVPHQAYGLVEHSGSRVTILVIKRGLGGPLEGLEQ